MYFSQSSHTIDFVSLELLACFDLPCLAADEIIADRRKEQAKASSGRNVKKNGSNNNNNADTKNKKQAVADRSIATGRAKRAAATKVRRGLSGDNKPSPMEVEKEVYRQSRKSADSKKRVEQKKSNGRLPPNSSLRSSKRDRANKTNNINANSNASTDLPGVVTAKQPRVSQIKAAIRGMEDSGCPVPPGYVLMMQFVPAVSPSPGKGRGRGKQTNNNNNNNNIATPSPGKGRGRQANNNNNSSSKNNGGGRGGRGGKK